MSAGADGIVSWTCTRIQLIDALAALPLGGYLTLEARGRFADCILGQLPVASAEPAGADLYRAVNDAIAAAVAAESERLAQLADKLAATVPVQGGTMPFSTVIRHQQEQP